MRRIHCFIVGSPGVGKSTLITRVLEERNGPIFGYLTRKEKDEWDETLGHPIYIYPAGQAQLRGKENVIGHCKDRRPVVYPEAFGRFALRLREPIPVGAVIIMDEIGFMEASSQTFCREIFRLLDGDIPVIAAVKDKDTPFLNTVRSHPKAQCFYLTPENRDALLSQVTDYMAETGDGSPSRGNSTQDGSPSLKKE